MQNVTEYEFAYLDLMKVFMQAMTLCLVDDETEEARAAFDAAFEKAKKYGWDWENDHLFDDRTFNSSKPETLAKGLAYAIQNCKLG